MEKTEVTAKPEPKARLEEFEAVIGVKFNDLGLLENALTHSSYANERQMPKTATNERLEFLGDAVLELVISEHLYKTKTTMPEGEMTKLRASIVCEESLSSHARARRFGEFLLLGKGERATGGSERDSLLADAFESVLGAIYLDSGLEAARACVLSLLAGDADVKGVKIDYKTRLQEIVQSTGKDPLSYTVLSETGPDHDKKFVSGVSHKGKVIGTGEGRTKKESEQRAARMALLSLGELSEEPRD